MKTFRLASLMLPALILASCGDKARNSISDLDNATQSDSISFYFGRSIGYDFWNSTQEDTTLRSEQAREDYLRGIKDGMAAVRDNDAYNQGLYVGLQVATNIRELQKQYPNVDINEKLFLEALKGALDSDSSANGPQDKAELYKILDNLQVSKEKADSETARAQLAKVAAEKKMTRVNENLYVKNITPGSGALLKDGDEVSVEISAALTDGTPLGMQFPSKLTVGQGFASPIISAALRTMKPNQTCTFLASPIELAPRRYRNGEFKPDQLIEFTIKTGAVSASAPVQKADSVKPKPIRI
ncbi:MAG: hypothetical protein NC328_07680 [Muribaculum sp.]|nr:hypothetical protein [Muribaculum sp.]